MNPQTGNVGVSAAVSKKQGTRPLPDLAKLGPAIKKFQEIRREIETFVFERESEIKMALIAIMSKEHMLLVGPPGVAKSMIVNQITQRIQGANLFEILMHSMITEKDLFVSSVEMEQEVNGNISSIRPVYKTDGATLANSQFAFLDEIYKSNEKTRDSLLQLMNERKFSLNKQLYDAVIQAMFFASNELPETDGIDGAAAFHDRILIRANVKPLQDPANEINVMKTQLARRRNKVMGSFPTTTTMDMTEIEALQAAVPLVYVPLTVMERLQRVRDIVTQELNIYISGRRLERAQTLLQAKALLDGRTEVERTDLTLLRFVLWTEIEHYDKVEKLVRDNILTVEERRFKELKSASFELIRVARKTIQDGNQWSEDMREAKGNIEGCLQELQELKEITRDPAVKKEILKVQSDIVDAQKEINEAQIH